VPMTCVSACLVRRRYRSASGLLTAACAHSTLRVAASLMLLGTAWCCTVYPFRARRLSPPGSLMGNRSLFGRCDGSGTRGHAFRNAF
jgi:hypothetical protein